MPLFLQLVFTKQIASFKRFFEKGETPLFLILDRITDVRNFGAIVRSAECAGAQTIIVPLKGSAAINGDALKTSAGALHNIPICWEFNLKATIEYLKNSGLQIIILYRKNRKFYLSN